MQQPPVKVYPPRRVEPDAFELAHFAESNLEPDDYEVWEVIPLHGHSAPEVQVSPAGCAVALHHTVLLPPDWLAPEAQPSPLVMATAQDRPHAVQSYLAEVFSQHLGVITLPPRVRFVARKGAIVPPGRVDLGVLDSAGQD